MSIDFAQIIAAELGIQRQQAARSIELFDNENTVPFVARYRKEVTGGLDEAQLRTILERLTYLRNLEARKETVLRSIAEQGKLTDELRQRIESTDTLQAVEDLYLPYKPKRRTRATIARERGLEPLAQAILAQELTKGNLEEIAAAYLSDDVPTAEVAFAGACDIIAESVAEDADTRAGVRERTRKEAWLAVSVADKAKDERGVYEVYYDYREKLSAIPPHRLLAINRGEREGVLKVKFDGPDDELIQTIQARMVKNPRSVFTTYLRQAIADGYKRLLAPSIENELRGELTDTSDEHAINTFAANLRQLLLQPPLKGKTIIGIDPGFRTGCKVALVDPTGKFLGGTTIYPHEPQKKWNEAKQILLKLIEQGADVIAIGNGTASRETEALAAEIIGEAKSRIPQGHNVSNLQSPPSYVIVNEAGASVYSASDLARAEFPDLDVSMRGAISIARRLQDPLAELVKIDPKSIGVGLYQHDVNQKQLAETLDTVVESAVNHVGVDVNTASAPLLSYVAGVSRRVADAIVKHREENGPFRRREALRKIKGLGDKTYQQAVGFLKIPGGDHPLDNTFIHPESYPVVERLFAHLRVRGDEKELPGKIETLRKGNIKELARQLEVGEPTLADILESLAKPGRDPRDELPAPLLRQDVLKLEDLKEGMVLSGTVRNVVDFGAFVDIGVKQDGLVHISHLADRYIKSPFEVVSVGDVVKVKVIKIDAQRGRIGLSIKEAG
ncbi:MAG: RNA-binding transcriptional accessory protein [Anaerolineae bacterium]|nr:RNA-binding transcriptional accessory protein [Anaerolineales bacterium]MCQ3976001.1 RNA-binding transcriptional accessory protein [Anaerolineae bacterium]